jgi:hypothetical protein
MGLLEDFGRDSASVGFGSLRYLRSFKPRPNISKIKLNDDSGTAYLKIGDSVELKESAVGISYTAALGLTYDIFMSIYDVNRHSLIAGRFIDFDIGVRKKFESFIASVKMPRNLEVRIIGMQDSEGHSELVGVFGFVKRIGAAVVEIDIFGKETRNVAVDVHRGASFNVLVFDRLYKQGELENMMTKEQFERSLLP